MSDQLDHSAFIIRHHKQAPQDSAETQQNSALSRGVFLVILALFFLVVCWAAAIVTGINLFWLTTATLVFLVAVLISVTIYRGGASAPQDEQFELIKQVLEGSRGARLITDPQDKTVYSNSRFDEMCEGFGPPGFSALVSLFSADQNALTHFHTLADQAYRGLTDSVELCVMGDDQEKWYEVTVQPVQGWSGYIHWRIDDVTGRHVLNMAIREEREKLLDFTDNAPVGFFSVDEEGRFLFVNATLARWLGEDIDTLLSTGRLHAYLVNPPGSNPWDIVAESGFRQTAELKMKGPAGKVFTVSISQMVSIEVDGKVRTRSVVYDQSSEQAMRLALQASEDRFQRFFEEAPLGIALVNPDGTLETCNQAFATMVGMTLDELDGRNFEALTAEADRPTVMSALNRIGQGQQMRAPMEMTLQGHQDAVVQMHARRFKGSDTLVLHFIDLSQQKELEAQFVQSQKMQAIGQLAGGVAHDFNNLLTAMVGFCDLLLLRHKPGDPSFGDIMQIKQNANRAANLVRQLLAFSRQQTLQPKVQDITDILTELSHLLRRLLGANIELNVVHGNDLGLVKVDGGQMEQVLINLAVNARDAMDGNGHLTIETGSITTRKERECGGDTMPPGHWVSIKVTDTGCGMPPDILERIFEPFFTTKDVGQGTGLGLATVYGIIRQTGGFLSVKSKVGEGTTFTIYLPRSNDIEAEDPADKIEADESPKDLTGTARLMLVEDEDAVRTFSVRALTNKGYEVIDACSGEDGLEKIAAIDERGIDLLITDVVMPNMDGPTMVQHIRQSYPKLKVIFMSGYTEDKLKDYMGENVWFLPKPFTLKKLAEKVKEVLGE